MSNPASSLSIFSSSVLSLLDSSPINESQKALKLFSLPSPPNIIDLVRPMVKPFNGLKDNLVPTRNGFFICLFFSSCFANREKFTFPKLLKNGEDDENPSKDLINMPGDDFEKFESIRLP